MAAPTISSISPTSARTRGRTLVTIEGANFKQLVAPPATGRVPVPPPSVRVLFGTRVATNVAVMSATKLIVVAPRNADGVVSVTVQNIDADAVTIPGETATVAAAFTYKRPDLSSGTTLQRVTREVLRQLKEQVLGPDGANDRVHLTVHTDFDGDPVDVANTVTEAALPSLILAGPEMTENLFFSLHGPRYETRGDGSVAASPPPFTVDLQFSLIGVTDTMQQLLNLMHEASMFFRRTKFLDVPRDDADAAQGEIRYELALTDAFKAAGAPNLSNVRQFQGTLVVRGVDLDETDGDVQTGLTWPIRDDYVPAGSVNPAGAWIETSTEQQTDGDA